MCVSSKANGERIQVFSGRLSCANAGGSIKESFTVRRIGAHGVGVERHLFLFTSPRLEKNRSDFPRSYPTGAVVLPARDASARSARLREKNAWTSTKKAAARRRS